MLSRTLVPALVLLASFSSVAQSKDTLRKYFDEQLQFTNRRNAIYQGYAIWRSDHWQLYVFYPDSNLIMQIKYKDAHLSIRDGEYIIYFPKGVKSLEGHFSSNEMDGLWQSWYPDGNKKDSGYFFRDRYTGTWMHWYDNGNPKLMQSFTTKENAGKAGDPAAKIEGEIEGTANNLPGAMKVQRVIEGTLNGLYGSWYENGKIESTGTYSRDSLQGEWNWYREDGTSCTKEKYDNGKLVDLSCYNEKGEYAGATCSVAKRPVLIHPFFSATEYIQFELSKVDKKKINFEGNVLVQFTVMKDATVTNVLIDYSPDQTLNAEIKKIIAAMKWSPAVSHNRPIDFQLQLLVPYFKNNN